MSSTLRCGKACGAANVKAHAAKHSAPVPAASLRPRHPAIQHASAAGVMAAALLLTPAAALADGAPSSSSSSSSTLSITYASPIVKAKMQERDEAMAYKCQSMFDCDGDRRDYAKKQWADFLERGGPARSVQNAAEGSAAATPASPSE